VGFTFAVLVAARDALSAIDQLASGGSGVDPDGERGCERRGRGVPDGERERAVVARYLRVRADCFRK